MAPRAAWLLNPLARSRGGNGEAGETGRAGTREREGWPLAHTETLAPAKRSLFWRSNHPSHRCVCARARLFYTSECVFYTKAPGPRGSRGRPINLAAPPPHGLTSRPRAPSFWGPSVTIGPVTERPRPGARENWPPTLAREFDSVSNPGSEARFSQHTRGGARQGRDSTRRGSPTIPWAPNPDTAGPQRPRSRPQANFSRSPKARRTGAIDVPEAKRARSPGWGQ